MPDLSEKIQTEAPARGASRARFEQGFAILLLIGQPLFFFHRVLFNPRAHIPYDIAGYHLPLAAFIARSVRQGVMPWWDPYRYCGVPIHADITAQLFYPFAWISIFLGNLSAGRFLYYWYEWQIPLHMILGGLFTFWFLRHLRLTVPAALLGGTVYQLGGFYASQAQHEGAICTAAWLPFVLLCVWHLSEKVTWRWTGLLAVGIALTILSGFPAAMFVVFGCVGLLALAVGAWRRPSWRFWLALSGAIALGHGMTAVQLIPTSRLSERSVASERAQAGGTGGGLRVQSLASLVVPNYYHIFEPFDPKRFKLQINFTFLYVYCGIASLLLILAAPFVRGAPYPRLFFALTVISAIWMLGDSTPIYPFVYRLLPRLVRGSLYAEFALLAFSMFAALTAASVLDRAGNRWPRWTLWAVALFSAVDLTHFGANKLMNTNPGSHRDWESEYQIPGYPGALEQIRGFLETRNPPLRIDYTDHELLDGSTAAALLKLPTSDGDNPFALRRIIALRWLFSRGNFWERELPVNRPLSPVLSMLNVGVLAERPGALPPVPELQQLPRLADAGGVHLYRNPGAVPRFYLVRRLVLARSQEDALAFLGRPSFKPAEEAVVELAASDHGDLREGNDLSGGAVQVAQYSGDRVELQVATDGPAFLATSEAFYPGWKATVNGSRVPLYMTNGAFRGLALKAGTNQIVLTYWPQGLLAWAAISVLSTLLVLAAIFYRKRPKAAV